jgi:flagellar protein FliO/FliZ
MCLAGLGLLSSMPVVAAPDQAAQSLSVSPLAGSLHMLFGLGVVLALIALVAWLLRRFAPGQMAGHGNLRVVAAVAVGPKERVVLVDVGEARLVLGVAPGLVTKLHEMPRPAEPYGAAQHAPAPQFFGKFKEMLDMRRAER